MIVRNIKDIQNRLSSFNDYNCIVILCKYNGGKSSIATELIHKYFGEESTYYVTFIDQSKPHFTPRKSRLKFNELVQNKVIVFDEIDDDKKRNIESYLKKLIENNLVIILTNPYGNSNHAEKEIKLFQEHEQNLLPQNTLFIFIKQKE